MAVMMETTVTTTMEIVNTVARMGTVIILEITRARHVVYIRVAIVVSKQTHAFHEIRIAQFNNMGPCGILSSRGNT